MEFFHFLSFAFCCLLGFLGNPYWFSFFFPFSTESSITFHVCQHCDVLKYHQLYSLQEERKKKKKRETNSKRQNRKKYLPNHRRHSPACWTMYGIPSMIWKVLCNLLPHNHPKYTLGKNSQFFTYAETWLLLPTYYQATLHILCTQGKINKPAQCSPSSHLWPLQLEI